MCQTGLVGGAGGREVIAFGPRTDSALLNDLRYLYKLFRHYVGRTGDKRKHKLSHVERDLTKLELIFLTDAEPFMIQ